MKTTKFWLLVVLVSTLVTGGALAVSARGWLAATQQVDALAAPTQLSAAASAPAQASTTSERVEAVVLTLRPTGFEPAELTMPQGRYLVVASNRTGLDEVALRLEREGVGIIQEVRLPRYQRSWRRMVDLPVGTYVLTETDHPEWTCRVTVTPR